MATRQLIGVDRVLGQLRTLHAESQTTIRDAQARLAFHVRDAMAAEVDRSLEWSGPGTRRFIAGPGAWRVQYRTRSGAFEAEITPKPDAGALIARHVAPHVNTPSQRADLIVNGKLAIPIPAVVRRDRSGHVPALLLPSALLTRDPKGRSRGFINRRGTAIMLRLKSGEVVPAYALRTQTSQRKRIDLDGAADRAVAQHAGPAFAAAIAKARRTAGIT